MKKMILSALMLLGATNLYAKPTEAQIKAAIPDLPKVMSIDETKIKGLYQVVTESSLFFVDEKVAHLVSGEIYDVKTKESLTREAIDQVKIRIIAKQQEQFRLMLEKADKSLAIVEKKGNGSRVLYVFTDPLCPFCKKIEGELAQLTDITIYRFMTPFKGPAAVTQAANIWCSKDRLAAWNDAMTGKTIKAAECPTSLDQTMDLVKRLGVKGTPTLFKPDGSRKDGAAPKDAIEAWLAE